MFSLRTCLRVLTASALPALLQALSKPRANNNYGASSATKGVSHAAAQGAEHKGHPQAKTGGWPSPDDIHITAKAGKNRPNIIWVMSDDLGYGEVGIYPATSGNGRIATPNLDKFGREGMQFKNAYAGYSVCAPSRTTFFTGIHPGRFTHHGLDGLELLRNSSVPNLADMLQKAGYWTGAVGKISPLTMPQSQGFHRFVGQVDQSECHNMYPFTLDRANGRNNYLLPLNENVTFNGRQMCMTNPENFNYSMDVFHKLAMNWVQERSAYPDVPFFLYLAYTVPHAGGWRGIIQTGNPVPTNGFYAQENWDVVEMDHASVITYMDQLFGDLMRLLQRLGIDDKTLVFFASDNGAHSEGGHHKEFFNSTGGLRGQKRSLYEGGVRSPTMVRWPGHIEANSVSNLRWAFWDVLPTVADIVGLHMRPFDEKVDGISIAPTLLGNHERQTQHKYLFFTWDGGYSIIMDNLKGVVQKCKEPMKPGRDDEFELYNLTSDHFESYNLADQAAYSTFITRMRHVVLDTVADAHCFQCWYRQTLNPWDEVGLENDAEAEGFQLPEFEDVIASRR